jgi:hypothetical protein
MNRFCFGEGLPHMCMVASEGACLEQTACGDAPIPPTTIKSTEAFRGPPIWSKRYRFLANHRSRFSQQPIVPPVPNFAGEMSVDLFLLPGSAHYLPLLATNEKMNPESKALAV